MWKYIYHLTFKKWMFPRIFLMLCFSIAITSNSLLITKISGITQSSTFILSNQDHEGFLHVWEAGLSSSIFLDTQDKEIGGLSRTHNPCVSWVYYDTDNFYRNWSKWILSPGSDSLWKICKLKLGCCKLKKVYFLYPFPASFKFSNKN